MDAVVLDEIPLTFDAAAVLRRVRVDEAGADAEAVRGLIAQAERIGRPKALLKECYFQHRDGDTVHIDGVAFASRVLRVNTEGAHKVYAFLATCGTELQQWARSLDDMLEQYWADAIMELALHQARLHLNGRFSQIMPLEQTAVMNPGSLANWPISQQKPLFALIGPAADRIGVTLTDSCLMTPAKSVSGIRFPAEVRFENCQLCPRGDCPGRRAEYDHDLYQRRYA